MKKGKAYQVKGTQAQLPSPVKTEKMQYLNTIVGRFNCEAIAIFPPKKKPLEDPKDQYVHLRIHQEGGSVKSMITLSNLMGDVPSCVVAKDGVISINPFTAEVIDQVLTLVN